MIYSVSSTDVKSLLKLNNYQLPLMHVTSLFQLELRCNWKYDIQSYRSADPRWQRT